MGKWITAEVMAVTHLPTAPTTTATAGGCSAISGFVWPQSNGSTMGTMSPSMMKWARFG